MILNIFFKAQGGEITNVFTEKHDIGLHVSIAARFIAYRDLLFFYLFSYLIVWVLFVTIDTMLVCKAAMCLYDLLRWYTGPTF